MKVKQFLEMHVLRHFKEMLQSSRVSCHVIPIIYNVNKKICWGFPNKTKRLSNPDPPDETLMCGAFDKHLADGTVCVITGQYIFLRKTLCRVTNQSNESSRSLKESVYIVTALRVTGLHFLALFFCFLLFLLLMILLLLLLLLMMMMLLMLLLLLCVVLCCVLCVCVWWGGGITIGMKEILADLYGTVHLPGNLSRYRYSIQVLSKTQTFLSHLCSKLWDSVAERGLKAHYSSQRVIICSFGTNR